MRFFYCLVLLATTTVGFLFLPCVNADSNPHTLNTVAPPLTGGPWLNTPQEKSLSLADRKGKVTVVHFWTFACSNCRANIPIYNRWQTQFASQDVAIIGVHTPELAHEKAVANVRREIQKLNIKWPVLIDGDYANWNRWKQEYWPTVYLIDKHGKVRYQWIGEMGEAGEKQMTRRIEQLQKEKA
jgi:thiol-disulfide isomerase/thioredoxin